MSTETSCRFSHLLQVSKNLSEVWFYTVFFMILYMHNLYPQGRGWQPIGDEVFMSTGTSLVICCKFKKNVFEVWFYTIFFMILYMYIALDQGETAPRGQSFDVNRNIFSLHSFVASLKKMSFEVWFYTIFFHDLIHVYSPWAGAGADSPLGTKFLMSTEMSCHFIHLLQVSK